MNPLYLIIGKVDGRIEERNKSKYLVFVSTNEKKEVSKKFKELWEKIKNEIETINSGRKVNMVNILRKLILIQTIIYH